MTGITFKEVDKSFLALYDTVPMNVHVRSEFRVRQLDDGFGFVFDEVPVAPYVRDFAACEKACEYESRFDIKNWRFYMAFRGDRPVGAMTVAGFTPGMNMLGGREKSCVLWDLRVDDECRHQGIGQGLFDMGVAGARQDGYEVMIIECQNINVTACRFYRKQGAVLTKVDMFAYVTEPEWKNDIQFVMSLDLRNKATEPGRKIRAVVFDMYETLVTMTKSQTYKGKNIAEDIGISEAKFREVWDPSENLRTLGKMTFEATIEKVLRANDLFSRELLEKVVSKRIDSQKWPFETVDSRIIPMLKGLESMGIKVALVSNCYPEERDVIRQSGLWKYFDAACLSCELGIKKPDPRIFEKCLELLQLDPGQCLYVGDGGSMELEAARDAGMQVCQAAWYLREGTDQPVGRKPEFRQLDDPMDVFDEVSGVTGW